MNTHQLHNLLRTCMWTQPAHSEGTLTRSLACPCCWRPLGTGLMEVREHPCHVSAEQRQLLYPAAVPARTGLSRQVTSSEVPQTGGLFQTKQRLKQYPPHLSHGPIMAASLGMLPKRGGILQAPGEPMLMEVDPPQPLLSPVLPS